MIFPEEKRPVELGSSTHDRFVPCAGGHEQRVNRIIHGRRLIEPRAVGLQTNPVRFFQTTLLVDNLEPQRVRAYPRNRVARATRNPDQINGLKFSRNVLSRLEGESLVDKIDGMRMNQPEASVSKTYDPAYVT